MIYIVKAILLPVSSFTSLFFPHPISPCTLYHHQPTIMTNEAKNPTGDDFTTESLMEAAMLSGNVSLAHPICLLQARGRNSLIQKKICQTECSS